MPLFEGIAKTLWSYVSPRKIIGSPPPTPNTEPQFKRPALPKRKRVSMNEIRRNAGSMSPADRVDSWRLGTPSSRASSSLQNKKRKRASTPRKGENGPRKARKRHAQDSTSNRDDSEEDPSDSEDGYYVQEDQSAERNRFLRPHSVARSESALSREDFDDDDNKSIDEAIVISTDDYARSDSGTPHKRRRLPTLAEEHAKRHVSSAELRAQGWDDDYITLIQKIAMRGYEPLLPEYFRFDYRHLPDGLFGPDDKAFIGSVRAQHFRALKALDALFELGGRMRDRVNGPAHTHTPEEQARRQLTAYMKWAATDADLDPRTSIPLLVLECKKLHTPAETLRAAATAKCRKLAARYRAALRVHASIESSSSSGLHAAEDPDAELAYPLPTFYAILACHTAVALMAYNPDAKCEEGEEPQCQPMAYFDFRDNNYDVWNALALASVVCHARTVQMRIAEETGIGAKVAAEESEEESDPDA